MRLRGGVVGNTGHVLIFMVIAMAGIVWAIRTELIAIFALLVIAAVVLIVARWLINFADRNPQAALYEGAQYLRYDFLLASKNNPHIVVNLEEVTEAHPLDLSEDRARLMQPDEALEQEPEILPAGKGESDE